MAICQESRLRYDELSGITFADIVITEVALLIFFTESTTENNMKGLRVTMHRNAAPWKAYKLLPALVYAMQQQFPLIYRFNWDNEVRESDFEGNRYRRRLHGHE